MQALDRVEDITDLRQCLAGVGSELDGGDFEAAAFHIRRFRGIERLLPVPESDVAVMRDAEKRLLDAVTRDFDAAIAATATDGTAAAAVSSPAAPLTSLALSSTIARCCQLMTLLGHSSMGLHRFAAYLKQAMRVSASAALRSVVDAPRGAGIDEAVAALNALSALLGRAASALESSSQLANALFSADDGPVVALVAVHASADRAAARLVASVARSNRLRAAMAAREQLTVGGEAPVSATSVGSHTPLSAAAAGELLSRIDDDTDDAPLAPRSTPPPTSTPTVFDGVDYRDPRVMDALLDEVALILQRCASYARLIGGRVAVIDSSVPIVGADSARPLPTSTRYGASRSAAPQGLIMDAHVTAASSATPAVPRVSAEEAAAAAGHRLRESSGELGELAMTQWGTVPVATHIVVNAFIHSRATSMRAGAMYVELEAAALRAGVSKASALEELVSDGASAASIDLLAVGTAAASRIAGDAANDAADIITDAVADAGSGALITTLVEDVFYVCQRAAVRSFSTGSSDAAAGVVNHVVSSLSDCVVSELGARLRFSLGEEGSGAMSVGVSGGSMSVSSSSSTSASSQSLQDKVSRLRAVLLNSTTVRNAGAALTAYAAVGGGGSVLGASLHDGDMNGASSMQPQMRGGAVVGDGSTPTARLTDEVAVTALILCNLQLAAECCTRLSRSLEHETATIFLDPRELGAFRSVVACAESAVSLFSTRPSLRALFDAHSPRCREGANLPLCSR